VFYFTKIAFQSWKSCLPLTLLSNIGKINEVLNEIEEIFRKLFTFVYEEQHILLVVLLLKTY
jgi:hypothetical protein